MTLPRARRLWAWIAVWAILLGALAPTVSRALAAAHGGQSMWVEVCSAAGTHWVQVRGDGAVLAERGSAPAAIQIDHCPLCVLASDRLAPPPGMAPLAPVLAAVPMVLIARAAPAPGRPFAPPLARGPPRSLPLFLGA